MAFLHSMPWLLSIILFSAFIPACVTAPPTNVRPVREQLSAIKSIALVVAPATLDVRYTRHSSSPTGAAVGLLVGGPAGAIIGKLTQLGMESAEDQSRSEEARRAVASYIPHEVLAQYFLRELRKLSSGLADLIRDRSGSDVDATIQLEITDLVLLAVGSNMYSPRGIIQGTMTTRHADTVIWQRTVALMGDDRYAFARYESDDGGILLDATDKVLRQAARRLAVDFFSPD